MLKYRTVFITFSWTEICEWNLCLDWFSLWCLSANYPSHDDFITWKRFPHYWPFVCVCVWCVCVSGGGGGGGGTGRFPSRTSNARSIDVSFAVGLCIISQPSVNSNWSCSPETPNSGLNRWIFFLSHVTLKFDRWPWKAIGLLFYATSTFVHHFKAICDFKLELQSGNTQFGSKLAIFCLCDLEIWRTTLKNNRAPLLYYFEVCASFHSH